MYKTIRTDMAVEAKDIYEKESNGNIQGVQFNEEQNGEFRITKVKVTDEIGERNMGKPIGTYITIDLPQFTHYDGDTMDEISKVVATNL